MVTGLLLFTVLPYGIFHMKETGQRSPCSSPSYVEPGAAMHPLPGLRLSRIKPTDILGYLKLPTCSDLEICKVMMGIEVYSSLCLFPLFRELVDVLPQIYDKKVHTTFLSLICFMRSNFKEKKDWLFSPFLLKQSRN